VWNVTQVIESLPSKCEALTLISSAAKKLNLKEQIIQSMDGQVIWTEPFQKKKYKWLKNIWKIFNIFSNQVDANQNYIEIPSCPSQNTEVSSATGEYSNSNTAVAKYIKQILIYLTWTINSSAFMVKNLTTHFQQ
jgi:hypothetical protein